MFDESLLLTTYWPRWRIVPALTLKQAALLFSLEDPRQADSNRILSAEAEPLRLALEMSIRSGELLAFEIVARDPFTGELVGSIDPGASLRGLYIDDETTVQTSELARWADARGIEHFWSTGAPRVATLSRDISGYPPELRAAIEAFEALSNEPDAGRSPRQRLLAWLTDNVPELGVNARERVATVANWKPEGGAPKTPGT